MDRCRHAAAWFGERSVAGHERQAAGHARGRPSSKHTAPGTYGEEPPPGGGLLYVGRLGGEVKM
jgi:hypothetical protein